MFTSLNFLLAHALIFVPLAARAASFASCMPGTVAHRSKAGVQLSGIEAADCVDQCTARGFEYSSSYFWDADHLHYCHCSSEEDVEESKAYLHLSYEGERCFEGDATIYHLHSDFRYTHSTDSLYQNGVPAEEADILTVTTPGACFETCSASSSDRVYLLSPPHGVEGGLYQCLCDTASSQIDEQGISMYNDAASWRRFDAPVASRNRLVFQAAGEARSM